MPQTKKEILEHYREIDFSLWKKTIDLYWAKLHKLKTDKAKRVWTLQLYTTYLQLVEVFCINIFVVTDNDLWGNLFLGNPELRGEIRNRFYRGSHERDAYADQFTDFLLENWVFGIKEKETIKNLSQKRKMYSLMLKEAIKDYLRDYELLNAYKHGFRVKSHGAMTLNGKLDGVNSRAFTFGRYNSRLSYIKKLGKKQGGDIVQEDISFNWERIVQKALFLLNMVENVQKILLSGGKNIQLETLVIVDESEFAKHYGSARFRMTLPLRPKAHPDLG